MFKVAIAVEVRLILYLKAARIYHHSRALSHQDVQEFVKDVRDMQMTSAHAPNAAALIRLLDLCSPTFCPNFPTKPLLCISAA
jgi:hypothetical protein